jgi:hypothetical protein
MGPVATRIRRPRPARDANVFAVDASAAGPAARPVELKLGVGRGWGWQRTGFDDLGGDIA